MSAPLMVDAMTPRALRAAARTLDRAAGIVEEAGALWRGAIRAGLHHARRTTPRKRARANPTAAARLTAWTIAADLVRESGNAGDAMRKLRAAAHDMEGLAQHVERGDIEATSTVTGDTERLHLVADFDGDRRTLIAEARDAPEEDGP